MPTKSELGHEGIKGREPNSQSDRRLGWWEKMSVFEGSFQTLLRQNDPDSEFLRTETMSSLCLNSHCPTQGPALSLQFDYKNYYFIVIMVSVVKVPMSSTNHPTRRGCRNEKWCSQTSSTCLILWEICHITVLEALFLRILEAGTTIYKPHLLRHNDCQYNEIDTMEKWSLEFWLNN